MKTNNESIYSFSLVKGMIAPSVVIYNDNPQNEDTREIMFNSLMRSLVILKNQAVKDEVSVEQIVDNCLSYFNSPDTLTEAFVGSFKVESPRDEVIKEKTIEWLQIGVGEKCLRKVKGLLLLVNEGIKNDCNN